MPNTTTDTFLRQTADVLSNLEVRYQEASFDEQVQLRDLLDQAMNSYSSARLTLLKNKVTSTPADIAKMNQIKRDLDRAIDFGKLMAVSTKLVSFLTSRFF
ncbi:MAG: hypothetical protein NT070_18160 [Cyanobacteria bacterium]|nr:hypothetical protein [Cyanobacteriota bacterium]